jgi:putative endonuclease
MAQGGWVYIVTNKPRGTLYIGVTSDIARRAFEYREGAIEGFTKRHGLKRLVFIKRYEEIQTAMQREKNNETLAARVEDQRDRRAKS